MKVCCAGEREGIQQVACKARGEGGEEGAKDTSKCKGRSDPEGPLGGNNGEQGRQKRKGEGCVKQNRIGIVSHCIFSMENSS